MNIVRSSVYTGIGTAARLLAGLVVIKLVARFAGPAGVGRLGQFMSLMSLLAVLAGGGVGSAIVKYVAEYRNDAARLSRMLGAALWYVCVASCLMALPVWLAGPGIAAHLLGDARYVGLVRVLAVAQCGIALGNYAVAVINGFMDVRRLATLQVAGAVLNVALVTVLCGRFGLHGALLGLVLGPVLSMLVAWPILWRGTYVRARMLRLRFDREMVRRLGIFSLMTLSSALLPPLVNMLVRQHLAAQFGWQQVGYWQAVSRVSDAYLLFLTSAINIHYLPRLAATRGRQALRAELRAAFRFLMPAVVVMAATIYLCRTWLTRWLFSADFAAANTLYAPQLLGDVLKIASFVLSYLMLAKAMTRLFVLSECVFAASYLLLVYLGTAWFGVPGAMYAFAANYLMYLLFNLVVAHRYLRRRRGGLASCP